MEKALRKITDCIWELPRDISLANVPGRIYAGPELIDSMEDGVITQLTNVCQPARHRRSGLLCVRCGMGRFSAHHMFQLGWYIAC